MLEKIQNLIYPQKCGICGKLDKGYLCGKCKKILEGEAIWSIEKNQNPYVDFNELISIFQYEGIIREKIIDYKFNEKSYLYKTFVNFLLKNKKVFEKITEYDIIVPVPISKKRKKERGYNQSLLIAKEISKQLKNEYNKELKLETKCLYKTKNTIEQSKLNKEEREKNAQNVYELKNQQILRNKKILLFDDIYTTGNTANSCCKEIKKAEPTNVGVLVLAKD